MTLTHDLASSLDNGKQTDMVVLDFSKAFDRVPHQRLLRKLHHYGIRGSTYHWISSFLSGRTQKVIVEGCSSDSVPVVSGVPQGSVLGPLLFLLFINALPDKIVSNTRLFADDCIVYRQINRPEDCLILQEDLNSLAEWESKWGMAFHPQKCSVLSIKRSRSPVKYSYRLKGHVLDLQDSTKYLGVDIQSSLSWKTHIDRITKKSNSMLGFLRRNVRSCSEETKANAYFSMTMVRSNLEYCSSVWSPHHKDQIHKIEMVQRRAARYTTNRFRNTSSVSSMIDQLQRESLKITIVTYQGEELCCRGCKGPGTCKEGSLVLPSEQKASGKTFFLLFFLYTVPLKFIPQLLIVLCLYLLFLKTLTLLLFVFTSSAYILFVSFS